MDRGEEVGAGGLGGGSLLEFASVRSARFRGGEGWFGMIVSPVVIVDRPARARRAFSFLELVVVLALVGVMAIIAVPRIAGAQARYEAETGARQLAADLRDAQALARSTSSSWRVVLEPDGTGYTVEVVPAQTSLDPTRVTASDSAAALSTALSSVELEKVAASGGATAAFLGVAKRELVKLDRSRVVVNGSVVTSLSLRTLVFNGYGIPNKSMVYGVDVGGYRSEVEVTLEGEVVVR